MKRLSFIVLTVVLAALTGSALALHHEWHTAGQPADGGTVEIPRGLGTREIVGLLQDKKVIPNGTSALAYIFYSGARHKLQAGEYLFDQPMTIPEVIGKLASGAVVLHKFTVPEGLTAAVMAQKWEEQGFGTAGEFSDAVAGALDFVHQVDPAAVSAEGYLFPETYLLRKHT